MKYGTKAEIKGVHMPNLALIGDGREGSQKTQIFLNTAAFLQIFN